MDIEITLPNYEEHINERNEHPEKTYNRDMVYREDAIDTLYTCRDTYSISMTGGGTYIDFDQAETLLTELSSSNYNYDEWCKNCKEYDLKHHNCPRFNKVIQDTLRESLSNKDLSGISDKLSQEIWCKTCRITDNNGVQHDVIHYGDLKDIMWKVAKLMI